MSISEGGGAFPNVSLSELLAGIEVSGRTWCYCDVAATGGFSLPPSDAAYFHAVLHGTIRMTCASGGTIELAAGDYVAVLRGEAHAIRAGAKSQVETNEFLRDERSIDVPPTITAGPPGPVAARVLSGRLVLRLPSGASRAAFPAFLRLGTAAKAPWGTFLKPGALALAGLGAGSATLLTRIAGLMLTAHLRSDAECRRALLPGPVDPIGQSVRLIAANPSASWTVERLARSVGMGRSNFAAHFTAQIGRAPMEVVAEHRMEHAADLLRKGTLKIAEISELSGYGSEAAFSRRFARHFGISPSQMRESGRAEPHVAGMPEPAWIPLLSAKRIRETAATVRRAPYDTAPSLLANVFGEPPPGRRGG